HKTSNIKEQSKDKDQIEQIDTTQYLLEEELIPIEEIYQFKKNDNIISSSDKKQQKQAQLQQQLSSKSTEIQCVLPLKAFNINTSLVNLTEPKINFVQLTAEQEGGRIPNTKARKVRIDIATRDSLIRCTDAALNGGEEYDKIFSQEMEKQKIEIAKEPYIRVPVFFVDPTQLKNGKHSPYYNYQDSIPLNYPEDTFSIKIHEGDRPFDAILSLLCTRGSIMTIEEAMKLSIWIEGNDTHTFPLCNLKKDTGRLFNYCTMILIGKEITKKKTKTTNKGTYDYSASKQKGIVIN
ncbi:MAG: hypothetical protein EZS28_044986, partial [Streblomastix strix]